MTILPKETATELYQMIAALKAISYSGRYMKLPDDADAVDKNRLLQAFIFCDRAEQSLSEIGGLYGTETVTETEADPFDLRDADDETARQLSDIASGFIGAMQTEDEREEYKIQQSINREESVKEPDSDTN